jgi:hypothetical protein
VVAGLGAKRAARDQLSFADRQGVLVERRLGQIPMHGAKIFEAEFVRAVGAVPYTRFLHARSPKQMGRF